MARRRPRRLPGGRPHRRLRARSRRRRPGGGRRATPPAAPVWPAAPPDASPGQAPLCVAVHDRMPRPPDRATPREDVGALRGFLESGVTPWGQGAGAAALCAVYGRINARLQWRRAEARALGAGRLSQLATDGSATGAQRPSRTMRRAGAPAPGHPTPKGAPRIRRSRRRWRGAAPPPAAGAGSRGGQRRPRRRVGGRAARRPPPLPSSRSASGVAGRRPRGPPRPTLGAPAGGPGGGAAAAPPPTVAEQARALTRFPVAPAAWASRRRGPARRPARAAAPLAAAACLALSRLALDAGAVPEAYLRLRQAGRFLAEASVRPRLGVGAGPRPGARRRGGGRLRPRGAGHPSGHGGRRRAGGAAPHALPDGRPPGSTATWSRPGAASRRRPGARPGGGPATAAGPGRR